MYLSVKKAKTCPKVYTNRRKLKSVDMVDNKIEEEPLNTGSTSYIARLDNYNMQKEQDSIPSILVEIEDEIEKQLEAKAERSNLSVRNVKNILQAVLTNEDVLKMVDDNTTERPIFDLKLTRAKTKQLLGPDTQIWVPPQKKSVAEILINEEFPEDSSDEEYKPHEDLIPSDEESKADESFVETVIETPTALNPQDRDNLENIGQRTRSKLCLSQTPLEEIEQAFIPPDITADMYNTDCDNQDWLNFLKEFSQPLEKSVSENVEEDDVESDPEYTFLMDEEQEAATDKEELRRDRAVKVTKKELNELMSELFEYTQMFSSDEEDANGNENNIQHSIELNNMERESEILQGQKTTTPPLLIIPSVVLSQPNEVKKEPEKILSRQCLLIDQQLQQLVQLTLQTFLISYKHPELKNDISNSCKEIIVDLIRSRESSDTLKKMCNLDSSLKLITAWEMRVDTNVIRPQLWKGRVRKLPVEIMQFCYKSDAFLYPLLLPTCDFFNMHCIKLRFSTFEDNLITLALQDIADANDGCIDMTYLEELCSEIQKSLIPVKTSKQLFVHVKHMLKSTSNNPIKNLLVNGQYLDIHHYLIKLPKRLKTICEQPKDILPDNWRQFCDSLE
ncbi:GON-4-like protein [Cimex lectularius]|uniref:GON-4-like protein n=1 Tax=Cimex lectularius TaxID=79782 RepID=A0A8I6TI43_CIMLE|nr:GON-4-like protein [Cimex lectularius]